MIKYVMIPEDGDSLEDAALAFPLGIGLKNKVVYADLKTSPHLLVAGNDGTEKTAFLKTIVLSMAERYSPDSLKFVLINPETREFGALSGLPHLFMPPAETVPDAIKGLQSVIDEMEKRYDMLEDGGYMNINRYNEDHKEKLPYIVVAADGISVFDEDTQFLIRRVTMKSRAVGIHVIISVLARDCKLIERLIKANFETRAAFKVDDAKQSIAIIGEKGAEKLDGGGDMLFLKTTCDEPGRGNALFVGQNAADTVKRSAGKWKSDT